MSGHSKWHNIQKTKGAQDAKRAAAFTKIAKEMYVAVKEGGGSTDPNYNSRLATVITKAKAANMPNDNIKRVLEKAASAGSGDAYESITYEGYGPSGIAVIVETMTDSRNRTGRLWLPQTTAAVIAALVVLYTCYAAALITGGIALTCAMAGFSSVYLVFIVSKETCSGLISIIATTWDVRMVCPPERITAHFPTRSG